MILWEFLGLPYQGYQVYPRRPPGRDRPDDVVQMWLDGNREEAVRLATQEALERSSEIDRVTVRCKATRGRPITVDREKLVELKESGVCSSEVAKTVGCSVTHVNRIWRKCRTK